MVWRLLSVFAAVNSIWPTLAATCEPRAISLPLKNHKLETGEEAWGISFDIGHPTAQPLVLHPNARLDATYLYGTADSFCGEDVSPDLCFTFRGGQYEDSSSEGAKVGKSNLRKYSDGIPANWTTDDVQLKNTTGGPIAFNQFEFGVRSASYYDAFSPQAEIGLNDGSTFLKGLVDANHTSSNTWSLFWGDEVSNTTLDGSLTLGGYDEALIGDSNNITVPFNKTEDRCLEGLVVEITAMSLQNDSSAQDVFQGLGTQKVCIVTSANNLLTLPTPYWDRMQSIMGVELYPFMNGTASTYLYNTTIVRMESATYSGNLSITLNDDLTITIPNNQLFFNEMYINDDGHIEHKPDIKQIPIVRSDDMVNMMPRIGAMFFSQAYLMVNNDKGEFTITQAQKKNQTQRLIGIDTANDCVSSANVIGGDPAPSSPLPSGQSGQSGSSSGLSGGAIAGIVVGAVAALAILAGLAFLCLRRRKRTRAYASSPTTTAELGGGSAVPLTEKYAHQEMYAGHGVNEMRGDDRHFAAELDGSGKPTEAPAYETLSSREGNGGK